jgi:hypothetical protein
MYMRIERVKRWQWIAISLLVGLVIGFVRNMFADEVLAGYGESMNSQAYFETAMLRRTKLPDGKDRANFDNLVIFDIKLQDPDNPTKTINTYAVAGKYYDGKPTKRKDGTMAMEWRPYFYPAPLPYKPKIPAGAPAAATAHGFVDSVETLFDKLHLKDADPPDSVLTYMRALKAANKVDFRHEWWRGRRASISLWTLGCFVGIGLIWPTVVNLVAFGRLTAPPDENAVNLRKVSSATTTTAKPAAVVTRNDMDELERMEAAMEARLKASGPHAAVASTAAAAPAPIRQLTAKELELAKTQSSEEHKEFGADKDDFYPTERHHAPKE